MLLAVSAVVHIFMNSDIVDYCLLCTSYVWSSHCSLLSIYYYVLNVVLTVRLSQNSGHLANQKERFMILLT